ncbi:MAG: putative colanic acid biosynthesis acetyltransferase [Actinobacteria bacterium]|nr:putative colanic acid biosynthesis acetyltransferase [Actinomycetota bacterium]NBY15197.1 putative colanic acid biosynthesis acetyltransferase [Actinomycetota bacterium]
MRDLSKFDAAGYDRGRNKVWQALWFGFSFLIFQKFWFPNRFRASALRLFGARVGENVFIRHDVRIMWPWKIHIGDNCWLGEGARIINIVEVTIGDDVCISQEAMLCSGSHDHAKIDFPYRNRPITIGNGSWIAARATVLPGAEIGENCVISAREIARGEIPNNSLLINGQLREIAEPS